MTRQFAIEILSKLSCKGCYYPCDNCNYDEALELAINDMKEKIKNENEILLTEKHPGKECAVQSNNR